MKGWYRASFRTVSKETWCRRYYNVSNVYLCPSCGFKADMQNTYWKIIKRKQHVYAPARCFECKCEAETDPNPKEWHRPMWREP